LQIYFCEHQFDYQLCKKLNHCLIKFPSNNFLLCLIQEWQQFGMSEYRIITTKLDWTSARTFCQGQSADLTSISSEAENSFVASLVGNAFVRWLGASRIDNATVQQFRWSDGTSFEYQNWYPSRPG
jgi:hypothetical protein